MPTLVYDMNLKRPACALLQAAYGGSPGVAGKFPAEHWLIAPTPGMKAYRLSDEELAQVVQYHRRLACPAR